MADFFAKRAYCTIGERLECPLSYSDFHESISIKCKDKFDKF